MGSGGSGGVTNSTFNDRKLGNLLSCFQTYIHLIINDMLLVRYLKSWQYLSRQQINSLPLKSTKYITMVINGRHWILSWAISFQSPPLHPVSQRSILICSSNYACVSKWSVPCRVATNILYKFIISPMLA